MAEAYKYHYVEEVSIGKVGVYSWYNEKPVLLLSGTTGSSGATVDILMGITREAANELFILLEGWLA